MSAYALDREEAQIWWAAFLRETISMRNSNGLINSPTSPSRRYVSARLRVYSGLFCIVLDCLRQEPTINEAYIFDTDLGRALFLQKEVVSQAVLLHITTTSPSLPKIRRFNQVWNTRGKHNNCSRSWHVFSKSDVLM
jgi:hypothetical protein